MVATKLRQRRARSHSPDEVLPLYQTDSSTAKIKRRKRISAKSAWLRSVLVGLSVALLGLFGLAKILVFSTETTEKPHPSLVDKVKQYHGNFGRASRHVVPTKKQSSSSSLQQRSLFQCADGTKGILNDDYCDCPDGADEPSTAACSHILIQKESFMCRDGSGAIYTSRVKDGVRDCPDGSDESLMKVTTNVNRQLEQSEDSNSAG